MSKLKSTLEHTPRWSAVINFIIIGIILVTVVWGHTTTNNQLKETRDVYTQLLIDVLETSAKYGNEDEGVVEITKDIFKRIGEDSGRIAALYNEKYMPEVIGLYDGGQFDITEYKSLIRATEESNEGSVRLQINDSGWDVYFKWLDPENTNQRYLLLIYGRSDNLFDYSIISLHGIIVILLVFLLMLKVTVFDNMILQRILLDISKLRY